VSVKQLPGFQGEMTTMRIPILFAVTATIALAACSGGGGGGGSTSMPSTGTPGSQTSSASQSAIDAANSLGDPIKADSNYNDTTSGTEMASRTMSANRALTNGVCTSGVEFFAPDKNGDANSTEEQYFYDTACTQLAVDIVRIYTINGSSETVDRTTNQYAIGNSTAIATATATVTYATGTYGTYGYPIAADGFARSTTEQLAISGSKTLADDDELIMQAGSGGVNTWCGDSAGYNETGIASLNKTFGWQGGVLSGGTRTVNANGSVTWSSTHAGMSFSGAIGSLSIATGTLNTTCPITTPAFTISGGTSGGSYSIPVSATFMYGELVGLTVTNASLANGDTLNVTTNTSLTPGNSDFITGTVSNGGTQIATFAVNGFGSGTLTMSSNGGQFVIQDWHVVK
jgi:hypothetical protein